MRRGFTLIELLVVIAIIAILAAILFPVFARAREKARQSSCLSNVKQLTIAMLQYVQDYDERFPGHRFLVNAGYGYWYQVITPYIKNDNVFDCPSYTGSNAISYGYNGYGTTAANGLGWRYASSSGPAPSQWPPSLAQVTSPANMIMLGDHSGSTGDMCGYGNLGASNLPAARHNDGANLSFVDGHAKWMKPGDVDKTTGDSLMSIEIED